MPSRRGLNRQLAIPLWFVVEPLIDAWLTDGQQYGILAPRRTQREMGVWLLKGAYRRVSRLDAKQQATRTRRSRVHTHGQR